MSRQGIVTLPPLRVDLAISRSCARAATPLGNAVCRVPVNRLQRLGVYGTTGRPFYQCAQCGAPIIADKWSEYMSERQVRNVWSCDACGYQFETAACFPKVDQAA